MSSTIEIVIDVAAGAANFVQGRLYRDGRLLSGYQGGRAHYPTNLDDHAFLLEVLEAQLANCIAFCRACADLCNSHGERHRHCAVCAEACLACADACNAMLATMRMPA